MRAKPVYHFSFIISHSSFLISHFFIVLSISEREVRITTLAGILNSEFVVLSRLGGRLQK